MLFHGYRAAEQLDGLTNDLPVSTCKLDLFTVPESELDSYMLGKAYFDMKEYDRCSHILSGCVSSIPSFLKYYAQYLSISKRNLEAMGDIFGKFGLIRVTT